MPSFEIDKTQAIGGLRALAETDRTALDASSRPASGSAHTVPSGVALEIGGGLDAGTPPVDTDRVSQVRNALRDGTYPLVPAKIADAMIAAQLRPVVGP